ncbi:hypothetical protein ACXET9_12500 [Brachybacterium sp. DNPG3]
MPTPRLAAVPAAPAAPLLASPDATVSATPGIAAPAAPVIAAPAAPGITAPAAPDVAATAAPSSARTGSSAARSAFTPDAPEQAITLWGSSSMNSEGGADGTPLPIRIHEHLALAADPAIVHAYGVGATRSQHTVLMRGLDTPLASPVEDPDPETGAVAVSLDSGLAPYGPINVPGTLGAVAGTLDGTSGTWIFTPSTPETEVVEGTFVSALREIAAGARQILWVGKNNIGDVDRVLADTQRIWDAADDPEHDTIVLGQWATENDPVGSTTATALARVNAEQKERYGDRFLDVQTLLTSEDGLGCSPIAGLAVLEQGASQDALERGVVPPMLIASDAIHLNGWGNLAVSWALVRRMRELRWL